MRSIDQPGDRTCMNVNRNKLFVHVYASVHFDLIFLNSTWYKNALNTPEVIYRFCRIKSLKLLDLNALKISATNSFPKLPHAVLN